MEAEGWRHSSPGKSMNCCRGVQSDHLHQAANICLQLQLWRGEGARCFMDACTHCTYLYTGIPHTQILKIKSFLKKKKTNCQSQNSKLDHSFCNAFCVTRAVNDKCLNYKDYGIWSLHGAGVIFPWETQYDHTIVWRPASALFGQYPRPISF